MNHDEIRETVQELYADGHRYVKSKDVAARLDIEVTQGKLSTIGAKLGELDETEKWADGHTAITWQLSEELQ